MEILFILFFLKLVAAIPPNNYENDDIHSLKYATKVLAVHLEKWNSLYLSTLEPRMSLFTSLLTSVDNNVANLQERAHVWDTFQLHVSAWNEQLASLDRKIEIISKGQEKVVALDESKSNILSNLEYKIDKLSETVDDMQEKIKKIVGNNQNEYQTHDVLFNEFALRGILSTVKKVEKKLDRFPISHQNSATILKPRLRNEEKTKLTLKCHLPLFAQEQLNDVASKVDLIFDKIGKGKEDFRGGLNMESLHFRQEDIDHKSACLINQTLVEILKKTFDIYEVINASKTPEIIYNCVNITQNVSKRVSDEVTSTLNVILSSHFSEQRTHFESYLEKYLSRIKNSILEKKKNTINCNSSVIDQKVKVFGVENEPNIYSCDDLDVDQKSEVYNFGVSLFNKNNRNYNQRYCLVENNEIWTVIQRRNNYSELHNFNLSWIEYQDGFGSLDKDFWFGNDFIYKLTNEANVILRIELEDFDNNFAWAQYSTFKILSEKENYQLLVDGYTGNASDSFSGHNGSFFSTYDRNNDMAPECCPCAETFGAGWWFNSCFQSNLNGLYMTNPKNLTYYNGIIWEDWLGNYSLKKSLIMVKLAPKLNDSSTSKQDFDVQSTDSNIWPNYEDP